LIIFVENTGKVTNVTGRRIQWNPEIGFTGCKDIDIVRDRDLKKNRCIIINNIIPS
jgi:hypothetical protein